MALHSPLLAELLLETGLGTAISLPFPLSALSSLADVLQDRQGDHDDGADVLQDKQGGHDDGVDCLQDVAFSLGISLRAVTSKLVKREVQSDRDKEEDVQDNLDEKIKEEMIDKKPKVQKANQKQKIKYVESSSESCDDDNDPDYMDISNDTVKFVKSKSSFKSPTKQRKTFDREFGCDHCNLRFGKRSNMMRHRLRKHDVPMECAVCDKKFTPG